jgi:hypothetical protein
MDMTVVLVTAGAGILIGLLIGLMINALRGDSSKHTTPIENTSRGIDNILLWHDQEGGNLIVDLDGSTFLRVNDMRADQRSRLETIYSQLKRFLGVQDTTPRPAATTPAAVQVEAPAQVPFTVPLSQSVPSQSYPVQVIPSQPAPNQSIPAQPAPAQASHAQPVVTTPLKAASSQEEIVIQPATGDKKGGKKPLPEPVKPLNIVGEIDEILQEMIAGTPLLDRGLQLVETPAHTIAVWVDSRRFESIDAVTDPEVQQVIRAAVKKWENKLR